jgi:hypothetical protein
MLVTGDNLEVVDPLDCLRAGKVEGEARRTRDRRSRENGYPRG